MKKLIVILVALAIVLPVSAAITKATLINSSGDKAVVAAGSAEAQKLFSEGYVLMGSPFKTELEKVCDCEQVGALVGPEVIGDLTVYGKLRGKAAFKYIKATSQYATTTLTHLDSGTTYLISGVGTQITLPTVKATGTTFRFVVAGATATGDIRVTSAEGDNIEGSVVVAGAVVDCDAADVLTFVVDGENIGDFVEVVSTGSAWVPLQSGALSATKLTCTG
jgi:hypothetical protein